MRRNRVGMCLLAAIVCLTASCGNQNDEAPATAQTATGQQEGEENTAKDPDDSRGENRTVHMAVSGWTGWKPVVEVNGGLETAENSRLGQLGIKMEIQVEEDFQDIVGQFISGDISAFGCSVSQYAEIYPRLTEAGRNPEMICAVSRSKGADVVLAHKQVNSIRGLLSIEGKIASYEGAEAYHMFKWHISHDNSINEKERQTLLDAVTVCESPEEAYQMYSGGKAAALCAGEPELDLSQIIGDSDVLLTSEMNDNVLIYGIVFDRGIDNANASLAVNFVAALMNEIDENQSYNAISNVAFTGRADNYKLFGLVKNDQGVYETGRSIVKDLFVDMGGGTGYISNPPVETSVLLAAGFPSGQEPPVSGAAEEKGEVQFMTWEEWQNWKGQNVAENTYIIYFMPDSESFKYDPSETIEEIAETVQMRGGAEVVLFGHVANTGHGDTYDGRELSKRRGYAVAEQLIEMYGIMPKRITVVGVGNVESANSVQEGDRRVDVVFFDPE